MDKFLNKIFKNKVFIKEKMLSFGFKTEGKDFLYYEKLLENQFELILKVSDLKFPEAQLIDSQTKDIYTLYLVEDAAGTFVGKVREEYENALNRIAQNCCKNTFFIFSQSNRLADLIYEKYGDSPEFLWEKSPGFGVFRNPESKKWYGLISNIDKSKLDKTCEGEIEILNIKLDKDEIQKLLKQNGFYPAYHMNKKSWITIILNNTLQDEKIMKLIEKSHQFSSGKT